MTETNAVTASPNTRPPVEHELRTWQSYFHAVMRAASGVAPEGKVSKRGKLVSGGEHWYRAFDGRLITDDLASKFTGSIDAALTLVPEGWFWNVDNNPEAGGYARMTDVPDIGEMMKDVRAVGRTPALALCIAALRARATLQPQQPKETGE